MHARAWWVCGVGCIWICSVVWRVGLSCGVACVGVCGYGEWWVGDV